MAIEKFEQEIGYKITGAETTKKQADEIRKKVEDLHKIAGESTGEIIGKEQVEHVNEIKNTYEKILKDKNKSLKSEFKQVKSTVKARLTAARLANRQLAKPTKGGVAGFFQTGTGKAKNMMGAFKGIGSSLKGMTKMGGMMTKVMGSLSGVMGALGISLGALSSLGAFVALLVAADKHVKEMNKSILNTIANTGELNAILGDAPDIEPEFNIKNIRNSMNNLFLDYRVGQQDALDALKAFGDQGVNVKSILGETIKESKGLAREGEYALEGIQTAAVFSHQLGKDISSTASMMAEWSATLGISVNTLRDDFTKMTSDAKKSGLGVNRFFAAVQNASAGLEMYGIRALGVSEMLNKFGKIGTGSMEGTTDATKDLISAMHSASTETIGLMTTSTEGRKRLNKSIQAEINETQKYMKTLAGEHDMRKLIAMTGEEQNKILGNDQARAFRMANKKARELSNSLERAMSTGNILEYQRAFKKLSPDKLFENFTGAIVNFMAERRPGEDPTMIDIRTATAEELEVMKKMMGFDEKQMEQYLNLIEGIDHTNGTLAGIENASQSQIDDFKTLKKAAEKAAKEKTPMTAAIGEATNAILTNLYDISRTVFKAILKFLPGSLNEDIIKEETEKQMKAVEEAFLKQAKTSSPEEVEKLQGMLEELHEIKKTNDPRVQKQQFEALSESLAAVAKDEGLKKELRNYPKNIEKAIERQPKLLGKLYNISMKPITFLPEMMAKTLGKIPGLGFMGKAGKALESPATMAKDMWGWIFKAGESIEAQEGVKIRLPDDTEGTGNSPVKIKFPEPVEPIKAPKMDMPTIAPPTTAGGMPTTNIGGATKTTYNNVTVNVNGGDPKKVEEAIRRVLYQEKLRDK